MQENMKSQSKCDDKQKQNNKELSKSSEHFRKHNNINTKLWELSHGQNQSKPCQTQRRRTNTVVNVETTREIRQKLCLLEKRQKLCLLIKVALTHANMILDTIIIIWVNIWVILRNNVIPHQLPTCGYIARVFFLIKTPLRRRGLFHCQLMVLTSGHIRRITYQFASVIATKINLMTSHLEI